VQDTAPTGSPNPGKEQVDKWFDLINTNDVANATGALVADPSVRSDDEGHKVTTFTKDLFLKWLKFCELRRSYVMASPAGDGYTEAYHLNCPKPGAGWDKSTATLVPVSFFVSAEGKGVRIWTSKNDKGQMQ